MKDITKKVHYVDGFGERYEHSTLIKIKEFNLTHFPTPIPFGGVKFNSTNSLTCEDDPFQIELTITYFGQYITFLLLG